MTGPSLISLVSKDGMLQRLSDSEGSIVEGWCVRCFRVIHLQLLQSHRTGILISLYTANLRSGYHQVVVASPEHRQDLSKMSVEQWENVLLVIQERVRWLYTQKSVTYVSIYVDSGKSGTAVDHAHLKYCYFLHHPSYD